MDHNLAYYIVAGLAAFFLSGAAGALVGLVLGGIVALITRNPLPLALVWVFVWIGQITGVIGALWAIYHIVVILT